MGLVFLQACVRGAAELLMQTASRQQVQAKTHAHLAGGVCMGRVLDAATGVPSACMPTTLTMSAQGRAAGQGGWDELVWGSEVRLCACRVSAAAQHPPHRFPPCWPHWTMPAHPGCYPQLTFGVGPEGGGGGGAPAGLRNQRLHRHLDAVGGGGSENPAGVRHTSRGRGDGLAGCGAIGHSRGQDGALHDDGLGCRAAQQEKGRQVGRGSGRVERTAGQACRQACWHTSSAGYMHCNCTAVPMPTSMKPQQGRRAGRALA